MIVMQPIAERIMLSLRSQSPNYEKGDMECITIKTHLKFSESLLSCLLMEIYASYKHLLSIYYILGPVSIPVNITLNKI